HLHRSSTCHWQKKEISYQESKINPPTVKSAWENTIQKLHSRLSKWKVKTLSVGGRLTLLKSVLGSSPLYIPKGVLHDMELIRSKFFNGADLSERKITWVAWDRVLASKKNGGLAIYGTSIDLHSTKYTSNWCSILREVQVLSSKGFDFVSRCKKRVGNGCNTRFWLDIWVLDCPLSIRFPRIFALEIDKEVSVSVKMGANSIVDSFRRPIRDGVERQQWGDLSSILDTISLSSANDRWSCDVNGDGMFRVKDIRSSLDDIFLPSSALATRWVKYIPIKINIFIWRARLDRLPTRSNLANRGVVLDSLLCPICGSVPEDASHFLFQCGLSKLVFRKICRWWDLVPNDMSSFSDWDVWFSGIRLPCKLKLILEGVFYVAWWHIWRFRNQSIFAETPPRRSVLFDDIVSRAFDCILLDTDNEFVNEFDANDLVTLINRLDISNLLHLHPNDYVVLTVVSIKLKGTENYQVWSCAMLLALEGKNKIGFIDGSYRRSNTFEVLGKQWDKSSQDHFKRRVKLLRATVIRINKDHPKSQIIGPIDTPVQTRHKAKNVEEQSFIATIHQKTNLDLLRYCLFSYFLSQEEPKKIIDALKDESWVKAMQEELLQF
ncbi:RNA-directed DNA polymerase, eukaryota, partial [Tanacetum coccineum]